MAHRPNHHHYSSPFLSQQLSKRKSIDGDGSCNRIYGLRAIATTTTTASIHNNQEEEEEEYPPTCRQIFDLTRQAIEDRGQPRGWMALEQLQSCCLERNSFQFDDNQLALQQQTQQQLDKQEENKQAQDKTILSSSSSSTVLEKIPQLLSEEQTTQFLTHVYEMEQQGWLSTNPDSVDGLPSLHLNLVSNGKPLFDAQTNPNNDETTTTTTNQQQLLFQQNIHQLWNIVSDPIQNILLPRVKQLLKRNDIIVSDVFLRRYGQNIGPRQSNNNNNNDDNDDEPTTLLARHSISAHYDVYSICTSVIALDNVAAQGTHGLYAIIPQKEQQQQQDNVSNHAALRQYFPLKRGDGVIHSWDILHGVDIETGQDRSSLIVWFSTKKKSNETNIQQQKEFENQKDDDGQSTTTTTSPWLEQHAEFKTNHVVQFVSAIAKESDMANQQDEEDSSVLDNTLFHRAKDLYIQSASKGNAFALTRLGTLCQENQVNEQELDRIHNEIIVALLLHNDGTTTMDFINHVSTAMPKHNRMARQLWLAGALRGHPHAQTYLADSLMEQAVTLHHQDDPNDTDKDKDKGNNELRLLATTLFGLAAQQNFDNAHQQLDQMVQFEAMISNNQDEFMSSPILQTAHSATNEMTT